jgi:hypothetical protein
MRTVWRSSAACSCSYVTYSCVAANMMLADLCGVQAEMYGVFAWRSDLCSSCLEIVIRAEHYMSAECFGFAFILRRV